MLAPGEAAGVHDGASERGAVAAHELGQAVHHHVGAVVDGAQQAGRGDGVVDHQRHAGRVGDAGQGLYVGDVAGRVADAFAEDGAGLAVDHAGDRMGRVALGITGRYTLTRQDVAEQGMGGAVKLGRADHIAAGVGGDGVVQRGLAAGHAKRADPALHGRHPLFQHRDGRIGDAAVAVAFGFQVEQRRAVIRTVERVGRALVDGHGDGVGGGIGVKARVQRLSLESHDDLLGVRAASADQHVFDGGADDLRQGGATVDQSPRRVRRQPAGVQHRLEPLPDRPHRQRLQQPLRPGELVQQI